MAKPLNEDKYRAICKSKESGGEEKPQLNGKFENLMNNYHKTIKKFQDDLPVVLENLRVIIENQNKINPKYKDTAKKLLNLCRTTITPHITPIDIQEMLIQHLLTEDLFITIFNDTRFKRENVIARELQTLANTFFSDKVRKETLSALDTYYIAFKSAATYLSIYHEKQQFLKDLYENFYRAYNEKAAIRFGVFYTPEEVVHFLIEGTEFLLQRYFGKVLSDPGIEILDPCVGTGTFLTSLIEWFPVDKLEFKYKSELHCNEVAILPYYVATQNIEYTYQQKVGKYEPFGHICFVDTLENVESIQKSGEHQLKLFETGENYGRIHEQNKRKICVIIGNPPYHANQLYENENNKNRPYPAIDERIRDTYIRQSTAQKTKCYDMYIRFLRWASDRLEKIGNKDGIIAFISNNSFLNSKNTDGLRKCLEEEFSAVWILNLMGDARTKGEERRREGGNIFENAIREGVAIFFLVKSKKKTPFNIQYATVGDYLTFQEKRRFLRENKLEDITFTRLVPDSHGNWTKMLPERPEFTQFLPLIPTAPSDSTEKEGAIAHFSSKGISTNRDGWVYDFDKGVLGNKIQYFATIYNATVQRVAKGELARKESQRNEIILSPNESSSTIKWSDTLFRKLGEQRKITYDPANIIPVQYRPFVTKYLYREKRLLDRLTKNHFQTWGKDLLVENKALVFSTGGASKLFEIFCSNYPLDLHYIGDSTYIPLYYFDSEGNRVENLTGLVVAQFSNVDPLHPSPTREDVFAYIYAILHDPIVLGTYAPYFQRESIRIPLYDKFWQWVEWGRILLDMHLNYATLPAYPLKRVEIALKSEQSPVKTILKSNPSTGVIIIDASTRLEGIPADAWDYKIGSQSAIDIVLDHYKERKYRDKTLNDKFNTYKFRDFKESVIILLQKVVTLSLKTRLIVGEMQAVNHALLAGGSHALKSGL